MNRSEYFNYIEEKLSILATRIELRAKSNMLELHQHSENFYSDFFSLLFDWKLENLNATKQNSEAIDLIDSKNKIIIQVSATATKQKIDSTLSKSIIVDYKDWSFKFISISKNASNLRDKTFENPYNINFSPATDIYDIDFILKTIIVFDIDKQKQVYEFIKKELGAEVDPIKLETNLASIINILAKENLGQGIQNYQLNIYEIEKKIEFNHLNTSKLIIEDYNIYHSKVDSIYSEFDKHGVNKSRSVLSAIRQVYIIHKELPNPDELFFKVIDAVIAKIQNSLNYETIPYDELELCVNILTVDAFIRCKIFENPQGYNYVTSR